MDATGERLRILHLILVVGETNSQYNEHCLPLADRRAITICSYFPPRLTPPTTIKMFGGDGTLCGFFRSLRAALDADAYDIVHAHAPHTGVLLPLGLLAWRRYRRMRPKLVYTVHDSFYDYKLRNQAMTVVALAAFARIVFCSHAAYESLPGIWKRVVRGRWRIVQNGADLDRIDRALASGSSSPPLDGFSVVSVGRLDRVKDPLTLVDAFARVAGGTDRLTFAGSGPLADEIRRRAEVLGVGDRVRVLGLIPRDEIFRLCAAADLFVSTSHGEGLPVAVIEAMATGCPVVLSDIPPHHEVLGSGARAPLVPLGDVEGFAREIGGFRAMRVEARRAIGRRGREHVAARFTVATMSQAQGAVYAEMAGPREPVGTR